MADIINTQTGRTEIELEENHVQLGDDINLMLKDPALRHIRVSAGWKFNTFDGQIDIDLSAILLDTEDMTRADDDFVFYNNNTAQNKAVNYKGDSRTGAGEGDDETISIDFQGLSFDVAKIIFIISIYKGEENQQSLGSLKDGYIRVVNDENNHEILRFNFKDLIAEKTETAMVAAELLREGSKWHFIPRAEFFEHGLGQIAGRHGLMIAHQ